MTRTWLPSDTRQRIQDLIKDSSVTQAELAGIIGLSESALSRYLKGQTEQHFTNQLEELLLPIYESARNMGFRKWTYQR